jgi:hypothetical protein
MDGENAFQRGIKNVGMLLLVERRNRKNLAVDIDFPITTGSNINGDVVKT